jgi:hypothetical protein
MDYFSGRRPPSNAKPLHRQWCRLTIALMLLLSGMASSNAQMGGGHGGRQKNQQQAPQQSSTPSKLPTIVPEVWPRLDVGAVLCRSRDELLRFQMKFTAGSGAAAPGQAPDCLIIAKQTAIQILDRDGPSRTHVASTGETKQTGWTNSYLPSTPPPSAGTGVGK